MRVRHKPYARPELAAWDRFIDQPKETKLPYFDIYSHPDQPFFLEVGCGKGQFLSTMALQNPNNNYLGMDIKSEMLVVAKRTAEKLYQESNTPISNLAFAAYNIEMIHEVFYEKPLVDGMYINFCNPWTKGGYAKHRLTHPRQLIQYRNFLKEDGKIYFKTDSDPLFQDSLRYFPYAGFEVIWSTTDLHKEEPKWNIRTEHEEMFLREGLSINACIAQIRPAILDIEAISCSKNI